MSIRSWNQKQQEKFKNYPEPMQRFYKTYGIVLMIGFWAFVLSCIPVLGILFWPVAFLSVPLAILMWFSAFFVNLKYTGRFYT